MVKGKRKNIVTKDDILSKITTYDIYRFYLGDFKLNEPCVNKYRNEKDPSLIIGTKVSNDLTHKDFGDYSWRGDAFHFVEQIGNCDYVSALRKIDVDMGLGIGSGVSSTKSVITWPTPKIEYKKPPLFQIVYYDKMGKKALDYWKKLEQGQEDLSKAMIFQPKEIWRNKKKLPLGDLMTFCYYYPDINKWKIYRPFAPKRAESTPANQWKWDSNVPFDYVDNLGILGCPVDCEKVFVTKSRKDRLVISKLLDVPCVVDVQAEDPACLGEKELSLLKQVPKRYILSDNDKKGKEFSWWLTKKHGFKHINVPDSYLLGHPKCTDFADLCYHYGKEKVIEHFKNKQII